MVAALLRDSAIPDSSLVFFLLHRLVPQNSYLWPLLYSFPGLWVHCFQYCRYADDFWVYISSSKFVIPNAQSMCPLGVLIGIFFTRSSPQKWHHLFRTKRILGSYLYSSWFRLQTKPWIWSLLSRPLLPTNSSCHHPLPRLLHKLPDFSPCLHSYLFPSFFIHYLKR